jgi:hypothetical protein
MADQHNANIPAMGNQISADIPDIKENLEHHKDALQLILQAWSDTDNSSGKFDSTTVFSDGTYTYTIPTNGVAGNAKFMIGDSSTIAWFYLNAAPPGWKVLSTGADTVLAVSGGSGDYNVNGGNPDTAATWDIDGFTAAGEAAHTHAMATQGTTQFDTEFNVGVSSGYLVSGASGAGSARNRVTDDTAAGSSHTHTISSDSSYRPKGSVGKLYQLDTA